jgi:hypothetical protein
MVEFQLHRMIMRDVAALDEAEILRMLGFWVSELDPAAAYNGAGELLGLTAHEIKEGFKAPIPVRVSDEKHLARYVVVSLLRDSQ